MATKKTKSVTKSKKAKKSATKTVAKKLKAPKSAEAKATATQDLDRKALAAHARQTKKELLAIRFNLQAPSLKEYRRKRTELQKLLAQLN